MSDNETGRFAGKTVIVTGAGAGIGRATALRIASEGGRVVGTDRDGARLDALFAELAEAEVQTVIGDITDQATIDRILTAAGDRIDGVANVAGIMDGFLPPAELDDRTWDTVFAVNVTGPMRLTRAVLPLMIAAGSGAIVNIASEAAFHASTAGAAYAASKHAIVGYTRSVAFFHGPQGIRANAVAPGPVLTSIDGSPRSEYALGRSQPIMLATMPTPVAPEPVAAAITWLLSEDSANVNGAILPSDGGWSTV